MVINNINLKKAVVLQVNTEPFGVVTTWVTSLSNVKCK